MCKGHTLPDGTWGGTWGGGVAQLSKALSLSHTRPVNPEVQGSNPGGGRVSSGWRFFSGHTPPTKWVKRNLQPACNATKLWLAGWGCKKNKGMWPWSHLSALMICEEYEGKWNVSRSEIWQLMAAIRPFWIRFKKIVRSSSRACDSHYNCQVLWSYLYIYISLFVHNEVHTKLA